MKKGCLKDQRITCITARKVAYSHVLQTIARRRSSTTTTTLMSIAKRYVRERVNYSNHYNRANNIFSIDFTFNFNRFSESECLLYFRFCKEDIERLVSVFGWPSEKTRTSRGRYCVTPILSVCIILRLLASPCRWGDIEELFGKHGPQLSTVFWESNRMFTRKEATFNYKSYR